MEVSAREGLRHYSPLIDAPPEELDELALSRVRACPDPELLLEFVGGRGKLPELFGPRRMEFAPAFYAASTSLVRFIAGLHGYVPLVEANLRFDREHEELERLTGEELIEMKGSWLESIGYFGGG